MRSRQWSPGLIGMIVGAAAMAVLLIAFGMSGGRMSDIPDHGNTSLDSPIRIESPVIVGVILIVSIALVLLLARRVQGGRAPVAVACLWQGVTFAADPARRDSRIDVIVFDADFERTALVPAWHDGRWQAAMLHMRGGWIRLEGFRQLAPGIVAGEGGTASAYDARTRSLRL